MTYDQEVLADLPVLYYKCEELIGTVLVDSSGNGRDGLVHATADFGIPGPIETDASNHGISDNVGHYYDAGISGSAVDLRDGLSWEAWIFCGGGANTGWCRNGSVSLSGANFLMIDGTQAKGRIGDAVGSHVQVVSSTALIPGLWYHLVLTRNVGVVRLYVNGVLVDEDITFSVSSIVYTQYNSSSWKVGSSASTLGTTTGPGSVFDAVGVSRAALYATPLSQARVLAHYEAALNALLLNGYSTVIPTAILYSDIEPTPTAFPFRHNWTEPLIERISFRTNISRARTGSEEASATRVTPRREIEFVQVLRDDAERRKLRARLWAHQSAKWFVPMLEDREQLLVAVAAGAGAIPATTAHKDYAVGGYVELRQLNDAGVVVKSEVLEVESFTASAITPVTTLANDYDAFVSTISPAHRAYLEPQLSIRGHTDAVEEVTIIARLLAEGESATPNRITPWSPPTKYRDYEVFHGWQSNDWSELREYEVARALADVDFDTGIFTPHSDTAGAAESFSYRVVIKGRAEIAALLGWFYERAGSLNYLWVPSTQRDFEVVSVAGNDLTVTGTEYSDNYVLAESRRDLAFVYEDGSLELRRVVGFSGVSNETLELDTAVPTLTGLRSVSLLKFCRLDGDVLEIAKVTDDLWVFAWRFRELLETPAGTGPSSLSPSASASISRSPSASASPSGSASLSISPSSSQSPSSSASPSGSVSPSTSVSPSPSDSPSLSPSASISPSASSSPSASASPSV